jgi:opacity protein-like surface antigen
MNKILMMAAMLLATPSVASAAVTVTSVAAPTDYSTTNADTITYDFDGKTPVNTGGAIVTPPSVENQHAVPVGSAGSYYSVGPTFNGPGEGIGSIFFDVIGTGISTVSFLWGSADHHNSLQFFGLDGATEYAIGDLFTGAAVVAPADPNGDWTSDLTNRLVTFTFTDADQAVKGVRLNSTVNGFEIDSMTIGAVPEPATWAMMMVGFAMVGAASRMRRRHRGYAMV